jgi:hypothetical protein
MDGTYQLNGAEQKSEIGLDSRFKPGQVFSPDMAKTYKIELDGHDVGQVLDGLEIRAESWRRTADYMRTGEMPEDELFIIDECYDAAEADEIAGNYQSIIESIRRQMEVQE